MPYAKLIQPGSKVRLDDFDPDAHAGLDKDEGRLKTERLGEEIEALQELLFAARTHGLLIVFQARDTGGKDGAINHLLRYVNVQSCRVTGFKVPTEEERNHDFLWRIHRHTPGKGDIAIFNRSHYEDIIAVRVHDLLPKKIWSARYDAINEFEKLLVASNTIVLKFYLHISKDEQKERLLAREQDPTKAWKLNVGDWKEREFWAETTKAYEDVLRKCSTEDAPWRVVSANHKWFRDLAIAEAIRDVLKPYRKQWEASLAEVGREARAELEAYRGGK